MECHPFTRPGTPMFSDPIIECYRRSCDRNRTFVLLQAIGKVCAGFRIPAPLMIYPPVLRGRCPKAFREGTRGVWVSSLPSMGICRGYGLRGGCGCRGDGRWIDDRGRDFVAAVAVDGMILG
jgi:hypothetical protein